MNYIKITTCDSASLEKAKLEIPDRSLLWNQDTNDLYIKRFDTLVLLGGKQKIDSESITILDQNNNLIVSSIKGQNPVDKDITQISLKEKVKFNELQLFSQESITNNLPKYFSYKEIYNIEPSKVLILFEIKDQLPSIFGDLYIKDSNNGGDNVYLTGISYTYTGDTNQVAKMEKSIPVTPIIFTYNLKKYFGLRFDRSGSINNLLFSGYISNSESELELTLTDLSDISSIVTVLKISNDGQSGTNSINIINSGFWSDEEGVYQYNDINTGALSNYTTSIGEFFVGNDPLASNTTPSSISNYISFKDNSLNLKSNKLVVGSLIAKSPLLLESVESTNILNNVLRYSSKYKELIIGDGVDEISKDELSNIILRVPDPNYDGVTVTNKYKQAYLNQNGNFYISNAVISQSSNIGISTAGITGTGSQQYWLKLKGLESFNNSNCFLQIDIYGDTNYSKVSSFILKISYFSNTSIRSRSYTLYPLYEGGANLALSIQEPDENGNQNVWIQGSYAWGRDIIVRPLSGQNISIERGDTASFGVVSGFNSIKTIKTIGSFRVQQNLSTNEITITNSKIQNYTNSLYFVDNNDFNGSNYKIYINKDGQGEIICNDIQSANGTISTLSVNTINNLLTVNGSGSSQITVNNPLSVKGETKLYYSSYSDPWSGITCVLKATGNVGISGNVKINGSLDVGDVNTSSRTNFVNEINIYDLVYNQSTEKYERVLRTTINKNGNGIFNTQDSINCLKSTSGYARIAIQNGSLPYKESGWTCIGSSGHNSTAGGINYNYDPTLYTQDRQRRIQTADYTWT